MSQSSVALNAFTPMKKNIIAAFVVVLIAHVGVLWAISHMDIRTLKPVEKKPLKVRFLTIQQDQSPPPAKIEPIQPKVEPKPVVQQHEPVVVEKPKVIAQKVQKTVPKVVQQDDRQEKLKQQQELDKQRQEQQQREQALQEQQAREQALKDQQAREQALKNQAQANSNQPKKVDIGQIAWSRTPAISQDRVAYYFKPEDGEKIITIEISSDGSGQITNVKVTKSSGNAKFDSYVVKQTYAAKFKPYKENGAIVPFTVPQTFAVSVVKK